MILMGNRMYILEKHIISICEFNYEVMTRTATKFLFLLLSCAALGSDTKGTYKEQNLLFVRHARGWKLESDAQKNHIIKPKIRRKAKKLPDVWQGPHRALKVQQALISLTQEITEYLLFMQHPKGCCFFFLKYLIANLCDVWILLLYLFWLIK